MTEFTKTKIHFALALLGTLFALHPFLERFADQGFLYLGYELKWLYAFVATAAALAACVYCFGLTLVSERSHSWLDRLGNDFYTLAVMIGPLFGGLYLASLLADLLGQSHLAWAAPAVALGLGVSWLVLSQVMALVLRRRLGNQDRSAKIGQFATQEATAVKHADEMSTHGHLDLCVMETWRAVEARLRRVLLGRGIVPRKTDAASLIAAAKRAGIVNASTLALLDELRRAWDVAVSNVPITKEVAQAAMHAGNRILASIAVDDHVNPPLAA
jgi:MFS family permease